MRTSFSYCSPFSLTTLAAAAMVSVVAPAQRAFGADDYLSKANALYSDVKSNKSADKILFPVLAKIENPPALLVDAKRSAMLLSTMADFEKVKPWVEAKPQRDVLDAVKTVTSEEDWKRCFQISQPYGADAVEKNDPEMVINRMYTELGEPALLAQADFLYMKKLDSLELLMHAEANRLVGEGKTAEAMDQLVRLCWIGRMMAQREFHAEKSWGFNCMTLALMHLRDVAYRDSRLEQPVLKAEEVRAIVRRLKANAMLGIDRITPPAGNRIAAEQLVAQLMTPGAGPDPERWGPIMARIRSKHRPLRMFSESAKWDGIRTLHANTSETAKRVAGVFDDFALRWGLVPFDPRLKTPSDYAQLDRGKFALVDAMVADLDELAGQRNILTVEASGTRMSLAAYAFILAQRRQPPDLASTRPAIIDTNDIDPMDPGRKRFLGYVIPPTGKDLQIVVFPEFLGVRTPSFQVLVPSTSYIVYSVGPDGVDNQGRRFTQTVPDDKGDYLIWPPVLSLSRQNLMDSGSLK